jgi:hypothetical protein
MKTAVELRLLTGDREPCTSFSAIQIEHGRKEPSCRMMQRLSQALDVQPGEVAEFAAAIKARAAAPSN